MIQDVVRKKLCTQCGFCAAICSRKAIVMTLDPWLNTYPRVIEDRCTGCRQCLDICSGRHFDFSRLTVENQTSSNPASPALIGPYRSIWSGYALDESLRYRASSGGIVSSILTTLLEKKLVKKVLIVRGSEQGAFLGKAYFVSSPEEVEKAAGSWYLPVSMDEVMRELLQSDSSYAVVGLPCHIQAWRKAADHLPQVAEKLRYYIGLFCDHIVDARFPRILLRKFGMNPELVRAITFRGEGWPGNIHVYLANGEEKTIPYQHSLRKLLWKSYFFTPRRCLLCYDALSEFADISTGDAWLTEYKNDTSGHNMVIVRNRKAEELCSSMDHGGKIRLEPLGIEQVMKSQHIQLIMKKMGLGARFKIMRAFGGSVPDLAREPHKSTISGYFLGAAALFNSLISSARWFQPLASFLPWRGLAAIYGWGQNRKKGRSPAHEHHS